MQIEYKGHTFEYAPESLKSYKVMKALTNAQKEPARLFDALDIIFDGKADEYAEILGDDLEEMVSLVNAIAESSTQAKN